MAALTRSFVVISKTHNIFKNIGNASYTRISRSLATSKAEAAPSQVSEDQGLILSDQCVKRLKEISDDHNHLRVSVEGGGCSGFQYKFDMDSTISPEDRVFMRDGVKVVIDTESLEYLKGSTVDFSQELIRSTFVIAGNPQAEHGCSCGASFTVKL